MVMLRNGALREAPDDIHAARRGIGFEPNTLIDLLTHRAERQPTRLAYAFLPDGEKVGGFLDYAGLDRRARDVAARLQTAGVGRGERALLLYPPGLEYAAAFLGCLYAGVVAVPAYPPRLNRPVDRLRSMAADSGAAAALTTSDIFSNLGRRLVHAPEMGSLRWLSTDDREDLAEEWCRPAVGADTLAFLQYTSGSTGSPKGVMVTHGNLLHNSAIMYDRLGHSPDSQMVSWLPPYHDMGLIAGILQPLYGGFPAALMPPVSFLQRPLSWLRTISRLGANTAGGPNFAYDLCVSKTSPEERATLDLGGWTNAFSGAEPIRWETLERFAEAFAPCGFRREAFYPAYGLAEATLYVAGGKRTEPPSLLAVEGAALERHRVVAVPPAASENARWLVGCGRSADDQTVVVADPGSSTRCPADRVGEVWVSGPSVARGGYWGKPGETANTFGARLADTGEGPFLRTGDLGFLHGGDLFVTGRLKDLVIIRGRNHYPQDIERTSEESHVALQAGGAAAFAVQTRGGERLAIVQELERRYVRDADTGAVVEAIRAAVAEHHELDVHAVVLVRTGSIPKTSSGKVRRRATRDAYLEGTLRTVAADIRPDGPEEQDAGTPGTNPDEADRVLRVVGEFVRRRGRPEPVRASDTLQGDLGLDSLAVAELVVELEGAFEVRLGESVIGDLRTVEDVRGAVLEADRGDAERPPEHEGFTGLQERLFCQIPQLGAVVDEQDGRNVRIGDRWCADFASANYLGLDLHPAVLASIPDAVRRWGVHPSWTRAVASPRIYEELERRIAEFIGVPEALVFPTVTLLHSGVLPVLAGPDGAILLDRAAHTSIQEAAQLAGARGTTVDWFDHNDPEDLERLLELHEERARKIIAVDGVYSMSGAYPPLARFVRLARKHGGRVYVDDAHGIGVVGEKPTPENPYGERGNGIVRHLGLRHSKEIVYVGGMSKAFSSMAAFIGCTDEAEKQRLATASTAVFSGPCPTASLASSLAGLEISASDEGEDIRARLLGLTRELVTGARDLGFSVENNGLFPLVGVEIGPVADVVKACNILWEHGILITPALFPAVPIDRGALRFTVTAANTDEQVERAIEALRRVREALPSGKNPVDLVLPAGTT